MKFLKSLSSKNKNRIAVVLSMGALAVTILITVDPLLVKIFGVLAVAGVATVFFFTTRNDENLP